MSRRKPQVIKRCVVCGVEFKTSRTYQKTCASERCLHEHHLRQLRATYTQRHPEILKRRRERASCKAERDRRVLGVSVERAAEIAYFQDCGDRDALARHAATWTEGERTYAKRRYASLHGISTIGGPKW